MVHQLGSRWFGALKPATVSQVISTCRGALAGVRYVSLVFRKRSRSLDCISSLFWLFLPALVIRRKHMPSNRNIANAMWRLEALVHVQIKCMWRLRCNLGVNVCIGIKGGAFMSIV